MGRLQCKTHGLVGFTEGCEHIVEDFHGGKVPHGRRFTILGEFFVCDHCFDALGFQQCMSLAALPVEDQCEVDENDVSWKAYDAAYAAMKGRRAICLKCLSELESGQCKKD